jgi:hypothetical protein
MYNFQPGVVVKIKIAVIALFSLAGVASASPDELDDGFAALKEAIGAKKGPDEIKKLATDTSKYARAFLAKPQPTAADEVDGWKQRVEFAKEVDGYTEYAEGFTASQATEPAHTIDMVDTLIAQNPKSKYLDLCTQAYLTALGKQGGTAKQLDGMTKIAAGRPDNETALSALADGLMQKSPDRALTYANRLVTVMKSKPKPEGVSEADWERVKADALGRGYYDAGVLYGTKQAWIDCDKTLKVALTYVGKDPYKSGVVYFYLGLANYQLAKLTRDKTKMQAAQKYSEQSAAIKGPMQNQAFTNNNVIKQELAAWR